MDGLPFNTVSQQKANDIWDTAGPSIIENPNTLDHQSAPLIIEKYVVIA